MTTPAHNTIDPKAAMIELLKRKAARRHLLAFTRYTMPEYTVNWHHRVIAELLTQVVNGITPSGRGPEPGNPYGVIDPDAPKRLIVCIPPRNGKSELASRRLPAY